MEGSCNEKGEKKIKKKRVFVQQKSEIRQTSRGGGTVSAT